MIAGLCHRFSHVLTPTLSTSLFHSLILPIEREVARGSNVEEMSMHFNCERESKEKDKKQISKEEGTNELEAKTP